SSAWLIITVLLVAVATFIVWPGSGLNFTLGSLTVNRKFEIRQGLDLRGGLQVLLEADLPAGTSVDDRAMGAARAIVESRVNAPVYHPVMTGVAIKDATVGRTQLGDWVINFTLTNEGSSIFGAFTSSHIGKRLAIVLDKTVISAPSINGAITSGTGTISGRFT